MAEQLDGKYIISLMIHGPQGAQKTRVAHICAQALCAAGVEMGFDKDLLDAFEQLDKPSVQLKLPTLNTTVILGVQHSAGLVAE